jgi:hypothetical protein
VEQQHDPEHAPIPFYRRAERLIKLELEEFQYTFDCDCGTNHMEYFKTDNSTAQRITQRWRAFCRLEPYDGNGNLRPFWEQRLRYWQSRGKSEIVYDHQLERVRWSRFANPRKVEMVLYCIINHMGTFWTWKWQTISCLQGFAIAIAFPSFHAVVLLGALLLLIVIERIQLDRPLTIVGVSETITEWLLTYCI